MEDDNQPHAFTCGTVTDEFAHLMEGSEGDITVPVPVFLIEHPKGRALFDTGLHPGCQQDPAGRLGPRLAGLFRIGFQPGEEVSARLASIDRANHAIRITSDRSDSVYLWFWPQMSAIGDRMITAAKQDMWEARREPRGHVFCGERRGKQCDLTIDQLRTWKGLVRVRFECKETAAAVLAWAKENGIVLVDDREKLPTASALHRTAALDRQDRERSAALRREAAIPPAPTVPLARPVPASPRQQPKPATSTLLPKMPLPPHLQRKE